MSEKSTDTWNKGLYLALRKLIHFIAIIQYSYAIYYDVVYVNVPGSALKSNRTKYGGKFKYLTFLDAVSCYTFLNYQDELNAELQKNF